ncbi:MAG: CNNM domain-containing protein [Bacteroidales bacterium]|nr:CNNM domain-containing protein [Bacteroidales bacterium]
MVNSLFNLDYYPVAAIVVQVVVITSLLLVFGEIVPKMLATTQPMSFSKNYGTTGKYPPEGVLPI